MRWLLAVLRLGERRAEVEADLAELFETRARSHGVVHAWWRLFRDIVSLVAPHEPAPGHVRARTQSAGVHSVLADLRHGVRLFARHPAVIGATVGGLALAIAVSTTVFTMINAGVIRPYGMDDPGSVVRVQMRFAQGMATEWPYHAFAGMRERARLSRVVASAREGVRFSVAADDVPGRDDSLLVVSGEYLPTLGGRAVLGRTLHASDDEAGAEPVVVLNHRFWTSRLNGDREVVGKTIWLSGSPLKVAGVLEPSFTGPVEPPAFWAPFASYGPVSRDGVIDRTSAMHVVVVARIGADVERAAAEGELSAIAAGLPDVGIRTESGSTLPATGVQLDGATSPMDGPDSEGMVLVIGAIFLVVGLVLALACANVANLLLAGASARTREIGVRLALGASRGRILRQLLGESVAIGLVAGAAGLVLSLWLVPIAAAATGLPETYDVRPDAMVLLFTAGIAVVSGAGAGLAPARHGSRGDLVSVLKSHGTPAGTPPAGRVRRWFIGLQAAGSILLLVTAALFLRAALHITRVDLGFDADRMVTVAATFPRSEADGAAVDAYWRAASDRVRAVPSVEHVSLALYPPFGSAVSVTQLERGGATYRIYENRTDAEYFATAGFRFVRGRGYSADEVKANAPVAVVSESVVRDLLGSTEPIGASLSAVSERLASYRIIGVVADAITARVRGRGDGTLYRPLPAADAGAAKLVIRAAHPPAIARDLEKTLLTMDPRVRPAATIVSHDVDRYMNEPKVLAGISGAVAALALVLAVLGVYGVTTFVVSQRMWELHVRQAIGASTRDILRLLVRQSLTPVLLGLSAGLLLALAAVPVLTPALSGLSPHDPAAIAGGVIVLVAAALAAVLSPARRAARADPASVLRQF